MNALSSIPGDIVTLRLVHCRAQQAARENKYHIAVMHYRTCLECAEVREDVRATQFFALQLAQCYEAMGLSCKAACFSAMAEAEDYLL